MPRSRLGQLSRNHPPSSFQVEVIPARLPCLAYPRAVTEHQQRQQARPWRLWQTLCQQIHQPANITRKQPCALRPQAAQPEISEPDVSQWIDV